MIRVLNRFLKSFEDYIPMGSEMILETIRITVSIIIKDGLGKSY
jgi:hypothetical protein